MTVFTYTVIVEDEAGGFFIRNFDGRAAADEFAIWAATGQVFLTEHPVKKAVVCQVIASWDAEEGSRE